jgi:SPP1 family predicted phage head-tail adaptor
MRAGRLDRRISIERVTTAPDAFNTPVETWTTIAEVWASKEDIKDGERLRAQEVSAEITTRFQIRWSTTVADVNPKDRLTFDAKTYDIFGVKEIGRREGIEITAAARADG